MTCTCRDHANQLDGRRRKGRKKSQKWEKKVRQGKEIRSMVWLRDKGRKHHKNLMGREEESVIFNFHPPFCLS